MKGTHIPNIPTFRPKVKGRTHNWNGAVRCMMLECVLACRILLYRSMTTECGLLCKLSGSWVENRRLSYENVWSRHVPPSKNSYTSPL
jgi:hypothetical protein